MSHWGYLKVQSQTGVSLFSVTAALPLDKTALSRFLQNSLSFHHHPHPWKIDPMQTLDLCGRKIEPVKNQTYPVHFSRYFISQVHFVWSLFRFTMIMSIKKTKSIWKQTKFLSTIELCKTIKAMWTTNCNIFERVWLITQ